MEWNGGVTMHHLAKEGIAINSNQNGTKMKTVRGGALISGSPKSIDGSDR
jgi:hypothetical protein